MEGNTDSRTCEERCSDRVRTPAERAIIYAGVLGGLSLEQLNNLLAQTNTRCVPAASYESMKKTYVPFWIAGMETKGEGPNIFGKEIYHPTPWGRLNAAADVDD
ncbi:MULTISPECIES: hypothetical protein [Janthinobacterium]|uniref:Uncharacterized protein n=1 Tax=Janthinobacterium kumbetense TaxID=2950280 RepID=A0ABT0WKD8_9BURK|nr:MULTISPECIES: hypothetical protein [Janthinobacterium]MCM2564505.1 hypothetical protein [Janthinobacterium kumbetense]MDO8065237.1 hypothetical protein [Janthinobacterium sp. SUN206]MDO8071593.1 hypothetical protein [Janthinobacterium sp. SUN176]